MIIVIFINALRNFCSCYSYAEMHKEEKNKISHRYKALALVKSHFIEAGYTFQTNTSI